MYLLSGNFGSNYEDSCYVNLVCSSSIEKLNELKSCIEQNIKLYFEILNSNEFPKQNEIEIAEDNYYENESDENLKILDDLVSEKFNWREEILKPKIPENILEFLGYLEDEDCCNLYIKEIKEI